MDNICYIFLQEYFKSYPVKNKKILEVGSYLCEGQDKLDLRKMIDPSNTFVGMDMRKGPGVDVVANSHKLPFKKGEFDLIINYNTLEHDDDPFASMKEMKRCIKSTGTVLTSTPCYFYIHDYPNDYFRYTNEGVKVLGKAFKNREIVCFGHPYFPQQVFGIFSDLPITNIKEFVINYRKKLLPTIYMDARNFIRGIIVNVTKKVFQPGDL